MRERLALAAIGPVALCAAAAHASFVWQGTSPGDGISLFQEANWIDSVTGLAPAGNPLQPSTSASPVLTTQLNQLAIINGGTPGGPSGAGGNFDFGPSGRLEMHGGTLRFDVGLSFGLRNSGGTDYTGQPTALQDGGLAVVQNIVDFAFTLGGTGALHLKGTTDPIAATSFVDLTSPDAVLRFLSKNVASTVSYLGTAGVRLHAAGAVPVWGSDPSVFEPGDTVLIVSDGALGSVITLVPAPGPAALCCIGLLAAARRRRPA